MRKISYFVLNYVNFPNYFCSRNPLAIFFKRNPNRHSQFANRQPGDLVFHFSEIVLKGIRCKGIMSVPQTRIF